MSNFIRILFFSTLLTIGGTIRVCNTFLDYYTSTGPPNCWDNLDSERNVTEIINNWGFKTKEYVYTTEDGYNLLMIRAYSHITQESPIVLGHGIYSNSNFFVFNGKNSLVYNLIINGYEVFILNFRGTVYSSHQNLTINDENFWNFSFHEMGILDLKLFMKKIYNIKSKKSIFIGYSMGSTISYVYSTIYPKDARKKLTGIVALAPIVFMNDMNSILGKLVCLWPLINKVTNYFWAGRAIPKGFVLQAFCSQSPARMMVCECIRALIFGEDFAMLDPAHFPVQYKIVPDAVSAKLVTHYSQIITSGHFQQQDFGVTENLIKYGQNNPPVYDVSKIPVPVTLIHGKNDWIATIPNVHHLYNSLNDYARCGMHLVEWHKWNHIDFGLAKDVKKQLYGLILNKLQMMESGLCNV